MSPITGLPSLSKMPPPPTNPPSRLPHPTSSNAPPTSVLPAPPSKIAPPPQIIVPTPRTPYLSQASPSTMEPKSLEQVPIDDFTLPLSRAEILIPGSDLTLLTWGTLVYHCESALRLLNSPPPSLAPLVPPSLRTAKVELIDLRTILPWDVETIVESAL
ncbi:hypothetical protein DEU56DRAFT_920296 [Suillus clintonianus]|uniref:uncharacterized protein n=1 Tax=Suillus clintonianus TaxID=1904413 RepID=UPI001B85F010|nr:uncharacterized protein DEU56DRAFT_920296 [Suillus clintonianus]KAG2109541.1 hypothetical protein DEU56DRAFT_920296 [Suillus clintonianus]